MRDPEPVVYPVRREQLLVGAAAVLAMVHALRVFQASISDDAFILYRYVVHLASGHGFVWNVGEPPIEGFTSLLHVCILAAGRLAGLDPILFGQILGVGFAGTSCLAAAWLGREISGGDTRVSTLSAFLVALTPHLAAWARGGLETTMFTTLLALALACTLWEERSGPSRRRGSLVFFLATLSRPEAIGVAVITILWDVFGRGDAKGLKAYARRLSAWWIFGACLLGLVVWKTFYFGSPIPNTYYAKTGGGLAAFRAGAIYVLRFARDYGSVNALLAVIPLALFPVHALRKIVLLGACVLGLSLHVARVGGDYQYFGRYLVPLVPVLSSLTAYGAIRAWDATRGVTRSRRLTTAFVVLLAATVQLAAPSAREILDRPWLLIRPWKLVHDTDPNLFRDDFEAMGRALHEIARPNETIAAVAVGAIGYYSERPVLDLMGLNDRAMAGLPIELRGRKWLSGHMRGDAKEILRRRPELIVMPDRPTEQPNALPSERDRHNYPFMADLLDSPEFRESYVLESYSLPGGRWMNIFRIVNSAARSSGSHDPRVTR